MEARTASTMRGREGDWSYLESASDMRAEALGDGAYIKL